MADESRASIRRLTTLELLESIFTADSDEECEVIQQISNFDSSFDENSEGDSNEPGISEKAKSVSEHSPSSCDSHYNNDMPVCGDVSDDDDNTKVLEGSGDGEHFLMGDLPEDIAGEAPGDNDSDWCKNLKGFPPHLTFTASPGLQGPLQLPAWEECQPVDFYRLFIDSETIKSFKEETNKYAHQVINAERNSNNKPISPNSMLNIWRPVTLNEITDFLSILIHMGVAHKPRIIDYWTKIPFMESSFPSNVMSRNRFKQILSFFHLNDNSTYIEKGQPGHDPLHKLRPLIDHLNHVFQTVYIPEQHISIHEALCPWRGRLKFKVYMKDNPSKWGIKLYELCESTSGYVWKFEVMCPMPEVSNKAFDVVHRLMHPLKSFGYCLYVDHSYSSPALAESMASENTGLVGSVRANRKGLPNDLFTEELQTGDVDFRRCKNTVVLRWKDKSDMSVISTIHKPQMVNVTTRTEVKKKPTAVIDYTNYMAGVDHSNRIVSYLPLHRKSLKWWKKLAFHLLSLTMVQAHCLYNKLRKQLGKPGMHLEDFVISVGQSLATLPLTEDLPGPAYPIESELSRLNAKHFGHFLVSAPRRQCVVCNKRMRVAGADHITVKNKCVRTTYECEACKKSLCVEPCFKLFHTKKDFAA